MAEVESNNPMRPEGPMEKLARARDKLKEWQQQYAPDVALTPKTPLPWQSKKVYGKGVVIETAKARPMHASPKPQAKTGQ